MICLERAVVWDIDSALSPKHVGSKEKNHNSVQEQLEYFNFGFDKSQFPVLHILTIHAQWDLVYGTTAVPLQHM